MMPEVLVSIKKRDREKEPFIHHWKVRTVRSDDNSPASGHSARGEQGHRADKRTNA